MRSFIDRALAGRPGDFLLLGSTPELALSALNYPGTMLAADRSLAMLQRVWPHSASHCQWPVCAEWTRLPLASASMDCVLGDGSFTVLEQVETYHELCHELRRVLRRNGHLVVRLFVRPVVGESLEQIAADLLGGRIGNFHVWKWRVAMALHASLAEGIRVHDIWMYWQSLALDASELSRLTGWPETSIRSIDVYRDSAARYTFPTLAEARVILDEHFVELDCSLPAYELGERCPTLLLHRH